ncbi:glycosyltransferase family 9 protein [Necropsobacter massiliensis]|uniref:glycosyltransferase family 9 protein n=1 Tax=Necropsobacter massiliensis TaxID=1400001 RepID=UPI000660BC3A|nr:glycosyltransferase family 9 protein [Necropsobacter massiliensis]
MLIKRVIANVFGSRRPTKKTDLGQLDSVLLNPVGDAIGDAVAHGLHLRQLKACYPHLKIGVFVTERNRAVFAASGVVDELITMTPVAYVKQRKKWDLYLDFTTRFNSKSLILDKILAPERVMIFVKTAKKYYSLDNIHNYDFYTPLPPHTHFKDYLKHSALGVYLASQPPLFYQLRLSEAVCQLAEKQWQIDKIRVLLCPQGSSKRRQLPAQECAAILHKIPPHLQDNIDLQLGYSAQNQAYLAQLSQFGALPEIREAQKTTVEQYLALVNSADIVLAVDSGTVHVACAFDKPLLAFYANFPTNIAKWQPYARDTANIKMLVGQGAAADSDATQNFDTEQASAWLNAQLAVRVSGKNNN